MKVFTNVGPIGIEEVLKTIIRKAVMSVVKTEVVQVSGSLKTYGSQVVGMKSAIHSMINLFESNNSAAILQTDATNDFNSLNCTVFLQNNKVTCPEIYNFVINCYMLPSNLFIRRRRKIKSQEGTMQNNPIAMSLYTLGKTLLQTTVTSPSESMHHASSNPFCNVAFADNFTGC